MPHTPGPWEMQAYECSCEINSTGKPWGAVAECAANRVGSRKIDAAECIANARLIAAAPELLEALERLDRETSGGMQPCGENVIADVRALIAKARGK